MAGAGDAEVRLGGGDMGTVLVSRSELVLSDVAAAHLQRQGELRWCGYDRGSPARCRYGDGCHFAHVAAGSREQVRAKLQEARQQSREGKLTAAAAVAEGQGLPPGELSQYRVVLVDPQDSRNVGAVARLCANYGIDDWWVVSKRQLAWERKRGRRVAARQEAIKGGGGAAGAESDRPGAQGASARPARDGGGSSDGDAEAGAGEEPSAADPQHPVPLCAAFWRYAEMLATPDGIPLLRVAKVVADLPAALQGCARAVAFTGKQGVQFRKPTVRMPELPTLAAAGRVALVFGNEALGLSSNDTLLCSQVCTLPTAARCTSLNLSHCAGVVLSRLWDAHGEQAPPAEAAPAAGSPRAAAAGESAADVPASDAEVGSLLETCRAAMERLGYPTRPDQWGGAGRRRNKFAYRCHRHATALLRVAQRAGSSSEEVASIAALVELLARRGPPAAHADPSGDDGDGDDDCGGP